MVAKAKAPRLPRVELAGRPDKAILADYISALDVRQEPPVIFRRDKSLARVALAADNSRYLRVLAADDVLFLLEHHTETVRTETTDAGSRSYPASVPKHIAAMLLAGDTPFPAISGVSRVPILRTSGTFCVTPGYDQESQMYFDPPPGFALPDIPAAPSAEDAHQAALHLLDLFCDFPFVSTADRANTLGLALTFVMRHAIRGPVPLAIIDAISQQGTGKTLLSQIVMSITLGHVQKSNSMPGDEIEMAKSLMSLAAEGATVVFFDNTKGVIGSASLEASIVLQGIKSRIMGKNTMLDMPLVATWLLNSNGAKLTPDMNRRAYTILMDAQIAHAYKRTQFKYPLPEYAQEHQAEYLADLMIMIRAWYAAGCPPGKVNPILTGTFPSFVRMIGGVLEYAGISGFLENLEENMARQNDEDQQWAAHLLCIHDHFGDLPFTTKQALVACGMADGEGRMIDEIADSMPHSLIDRLDNARMPAKKASVLGLFYKNREGRRYGSENVRLVKAGTDRSNKSTWRIEISGSREVLPPQPQTPPNSPACPHCHKPGQPSVVKLRDGADVAYWFVCPHCHEIFKQF